MTLESERFRGHATRTIRLELGDEPMELLAPASSDALLDAPETLARFERDEYMPYWADLWPTALILARRVRRETPSGRGELLELGCGLGLCGIAAARAGWRTTMTDYDEDAVAFAAHNARAAGASVETGIVDWRSTKLGRRFDRILGSDLLYERRNHGPIARFLTLHLAPDGEAWIGDSFRTVADAAAEVFADEGLSLDVEEEPGTSLEGKPTRIRILRCRHRGEAEVIP